MSNVYGIAHFRLDSFLLLANVCQAGLPNVVCSTCQGGQSLCFLGLAVSLQAAAKEHVGQMPCCGPF